MACAAQSPSDTLYNCCGNLSRFAVDLHTGDTLARPSLLRTNALGWLQSQANLGYEVSLRKGWSWWLGTDWCALNYFRLSTHFRTLRFQSGARYSFGPRTLEGWFVGAHASLAWYNYSFHGTYRYQDVGGHTPAWGGGVDGGYRHAVSRDGRWVMEYALGLGVYRLRYDRFLNVHNGALADTRRRVLPLVDILSVSVAYRFAGKKGGRK